MQLEERRKAPIIVPELAATFSVNRLCLFLRSDTCIVYWETFNPEAVLRSLGSMQLNRSDVSTLCDRRRCTH